VTIWQALRGQSLVAPDGLTLAVVGLIVVAGLAGAVGALSRRASSEPTLEPTS
jgi:hypothetical protein